MSWSSSFRMSDGLNLRILFPMNIHLKWSTSVCLEFHHLDDSFKEKNFSGDFFNYFSCYLKQKKPFLFFLCNWESSSNHCEVGEIHINFFWIMNFCQWDFFFLLRIIFSEIFFLQKKIFTAILDQCFWAFFQKVGIWTGDLFQKWTFFFG